MKGQTDKKAKKNKTLKKLDKLVCIIHLKRGFDKFSSTETMRDSKQSEKQINLVIIQFKLIFVIHLYNFQAMSLNPNRGK